MVPTGQVRRSCDDMERFSRRHQCKVYGPTQFQDFFGELIKLQPVGIIRDYQTQFEKLLSKVGHLPQDRQVSCFINGLCDNIKADVLAGRPTSLSSAIGLARLYEARNSSQRRSTLAFESKKNLTANKKTTLNTSSLPVRRMTPIELQERRAKERYKKSLKFLLMLSARNLSQRCTTSDQPHQPTNSGIKAQESQKFGKQRPNLNWPRNQSTQN
ncbi:hypothetical protein Dsin_032102 [Dipteronia sinensis]|uniref:Retrotransposon gag domain-containing protein n=1 Tax=Dipteronia sinensis TaxID=43782 RepID=A0AAE0DSR4_9ROSI|nr:hypothetical protein Dsin_032102 [Dipteronia sinensis]